MSNPFRNITAGALDLAGTPLDLLGLGAGAITGTASFLTGDGFWRGYADNPFTQIASDYHQGVTNLTGADEESLLREIVGSADALVGTGLVKGGVKRYMTKKAAKKMTKSKKAQKVLADSDWDWFKNTLKENTSMSSLGKNFGDYAITSAALGMVLPGESENDTFWRGAAAATLGRRGLKKLKGVKTKADMFNLSPGDELELKTERFIDRDLANDRRISWFDAQGGAVDKWVQNRTINEDLAIELKKTATDRANATPQMQLLEEIVIDVKNMDQKQFDKWNRFGGINATMGSRVGGVRSWLESLWFKATEKGLTKESIATIKSGMEKLGFNSTEEMFKFLKELDKQTDVVDMFKMVLPILKRMPEAGAKGLDGMSNINLLNEFKLLQKELGQTHFLNTKMKTLDKQILNMYLDSGMIGTTEYNRLIKDLDRGLYVPMKSDAERSLKEIYKSSNPMKSKRRDIADLNLEELFQGVNNTGNSMNVFTNKIKSELEAYQRQAIIRETMPKLQDSINNRIASIDNTINELRRYGKNESAEKLKEYKKSFGEVHFDAFTDDDVLKRSNKRKITFDMALDDLKKKYEEKGLYMLKSYTQKATSKGVRSVTSYSFVPKSFQYIFEQRAVNASTFNKIITYTNRLFTGTISGKWNPFFLTKRLWYGINEMAPALRTELARQGVDVSTWDIMKLYWNSLEDSFRHNYNKMMADALDDDVFLGKLARGDKASYEARLDNILDRVQDLNMMRNDIVGDAMRGSVNAIDIDFNKTTMDGMMQKAKAAWNWVDDSSLGRVLDLMKNSIDDASQRTILKAIDKYDLKNKPIKSGKGNIISETGGDRQAVDNIVKHMSDTRRRGSGDTMLGMFFNAIQDYMPYGATSLQGLVGKFEYLPKDLVANSKHYIRKAYKANNESIADTGLDVLAKIGIKLAELPDSVVFDTLWKGVAIPATLCYIWNYGNDENARYYNSLQPYERSNKMQMVNFFGPGVNLSIPMDQEWSILKNVYDAMLERTFGLGDSHDSGNPAFSMRDQILWSLGQDFGLSLPVAAEAAVNLAGYKTNLDLGAALNGEVPIEEISKHRFHTLPDGLATAMMQMTGKLGKILVNFAEDKPVMDYRYAMPFIQVKPKTKVTSDTVSWLNQQLKLNPTPELQKWSRQRQYLMADMKFYERNGCTKSGEVLGNRREVLRDYQKQLDDITRRVYDKTQERYAQAPVLTGQALSGDVDMNQMSLQEDSPLTNQ